MKKFEPVASPSLWGIDPNIAFLNNGSFGAPPLEITRHRARLLEEIERNPLQSLAVEYFEKLPAIGSKMADFVGADASGFVFVPNATFGANAVLGSLRLEENAEVVVFPHRYPAVANAAHWFTERAGATVKATDAPTKLLSHQEIIDVYEKAIGPRTALVIVDHISSLSGIVFPIAQIIELCRHKKVPVLVDGAHAPGQVEISIEKWKPDFYTGNFHKWLYGPRPVGFLYVAEAWRETIHPPILSNFYQKGFQEEFSWYGTLDPTPIYCVEHGLRFFQKLGAQKLCDRNHELAALGGNLLLEALGTEGYYSPSSSFFASMFATPLAKSPGSDAPTLRDRFLKEAQVEAHFAALGDQIWIRLSAQAFNSSEDMERLARGAREILR